MKKKDKIIVCDICKAKNSLNEALENDDYDKILGDNKHIVIYCIQCANSLMVDKR